MFIWERVFRTRAYPPAPKALKNRGYSMNIIVCLSWLYSLPWTSWIVHCSRKKKKIAQKKVIDTMCCSHALKFNEMNLLCFTHLTVTTFSYSKQVPQAVCCSLPFYITFPQWIFWSTVLPWEQITQSGYLSLYKLCKIRVDLASLWDWWFTFDFRAMIVHSLQGKEIQDVLCTIPAEEWSAKIQK